MLINCIVPFHNEVIDFNILYVVVIHNNAFSLIVTLAALQFNMSFKMILGESNAVFLQKSIEN